MHNCTPNHCNSTCIQYGIRGVVSGPPYMLDQQTQACPAMVGQKFSAGNSKILPSNYLEGSHNGCQPVGPGRSLGYTLSTRKLVSRSVLWSSIQLSPQQ